MKTEEEINYLNLKRMFNHILLNVPQEMIKMSTYRFVNQTSHECNSTGCIIGHCTILDDYKNIPKHQSGEINFELWSEKFTGLNHIDFEWLWCFSGGWPNNKEQILLRLKYFIDNQDINEDWEDYNYLLPQQKLEPYELI